MKVLLIIDHFGSGGAQRQMVELACGLERRGHRVEMFVYFPQYDFFRPRLDRHQIVVHAHAARRGRPLGVVRSLASLLRTGAFDVATSYLGTANIYAEIARLAARNTRLVVSERTSFHDDRSGPAALGRRLLHHLADQVVANSETQAAWLRQRPWLRNKVTCIYNGVDLDAFQPPAAVPARAGDLRLLGVGRIGPEKNLLNVVAALADFSARHCWVPRIDWAGSRDDSRAGRRYCARVDALLEAHPEVKRGWTWLGLQSDMPSLLRGYHALIHPSLYEGLPNAVCEALASGMPVLASDVCDHPFLVEDGRRGFLFDPSNPAEIRRAIERLAGLDAAGWSAFGRNARDYASSHLGVEKMVAAYEALFERMIAARRA